MLVFGLQGGFLKWCCEITAQLISRDSVTVEKFEVNDGNELGIKALRAAAGSRVIAASWHPDQLFIECVAASGIPFLVVQDDLQSAISYLMAVRTLKRSSAAREVFNNCVALSQITGKSTALHIAREMTINDPTLTIERIAAHLNLDLSDDTTRSGVLECSNQLRCLLDPAITAEADSSETDASSSAEQKAAYGLCKNLTSYDSAVNLNNVILSREFFEFGAESRSNSASGMVETSGPPRLFVFGPFILLPAGEWAIVTTCQFSKSLIGENITFDVIHFGGGILNELACVTFRINTSSVTEIIVEISHLDLYGTLEFRIRSTHHMPKGTMKFGHTVARKLGRRPELEPKFAD